MRNIYVATINMTPRWLEFAVNNPPLFLAEIAFKRFVKLLKGLKIPSNYSTEEFREIFEEDRMKIQPHIALFEKDIVYRHNYTDSKCIIGNNFSVYPFLIKNDVIKMGEGIVEERSLTDSLEAFLDGESSQFGKMNLIVRYGRPFHQNEIRALPQDRYRLLEFQNP